MYMCFLALPACVITGRQLRNTANPQQAGVMADRVKWSRAWLPLIKKDDSAVSLETPAYCFHW